MSIKVELRIKLNSSDDAFQDCPTFETARILRELAEEIERLTVANTQLQVWLEDWQQQAKDKDAEIERLQKELAQKTPKGLQDG